MDSFLSNASSENIGQVLSYIDVHEFDAMQNVFYSGERSSPVPSSAIERMIGNLTLASWNRLDDRRME